MWQNWISGILGLWIILLAFLGFSSTLTAFFMVVAGLALAGLGFWSASLTKPPPKNPESEISPASPPAPTRSDRGENQSGPASGFSDNGAESHSGSEPARNGVSQE